MNHRLSPSLAQISICWLLALSLSGCDYFEALSENRQQTTDPRDAFPAFDPNVPTADGFWSFDPCDESALNSGHKIYLGSFAFAVPGADEGWTHSASDQGFLLAQFDERNSPTAYLHAQTRSADTRQLSLSSFLRTVDLRFQSESQLLRKATEAPIGRPGYMSRNGAFTGWKWIGTCEPHPPEEPAEATEVEPIRPETASPADRPFLRLARTHGQWRRPPGLQAEPAFQLLVAASLPQRHDFGLQVAIVCKEPCAVGPTLAKVLGSIRIEGGSTSSGSPISGASYGEMAEDVGLSQASTPVEEPDESPPNDEPPPSDDNAEPTEPEEIEP